MRDDNIVSDFIKAIQLEFNEFFQIKLSPEPLLFFLYERDDMNLIWGRETEKWFVGAMKNNSIYILHPDIFAQASSHPKEKFWETLKHEYSHYYYTQITKKHYPSWLNEGLASYLSGKKLFLSDGYKDKLLNIFDYYNKMDKNGYMISQYWVEYLLQNFGKDKFVELIKKIDQDTDSSKFAELFSNIYDFSFDKKPFGKFIE